MNHLGNLIGKELKELITPASVVSILAMAIIFGAMGGMMGSESDKMFAPPVIGVLNGDDPEGGHDYYDDAFEYIQGY